jgi:hypothetical protein
METTQTKILAHLTNWIIIFISYLGSKLNYMYTTYKIQKKRKNIFKLICFNVVYVQKIDEEFICLLQLFQSLKSKL